MHRAARGFLALGACAALAAACAAPCPDPAVAAHVADSLTVRLDSANARLGRARALYLQQLEVTAYAEQRALYYAAVVRRRPAAAVYLVGWLRRAFAGAVPDAARTTHTQSGGAP